MWGLFVEPFQLGYMRRALAEVVILGVLGGVVGVHVLLRRLAFLTEVVQHTVFPGIAVAFALDQSLLAGALVAGIVAIVLYTFGARRVDSNALMALLISTFFALGVVVVSRRTGYQSDLTALLFGRILSVDQREVLDTLVIGVVSVVMLVVLHKELVLRAFDPLGSEAMGYPTIALDLVINVVVMLTVVAAVRAVGTVLVVAFIVTPAAMARLLCRRVTPMMIVAAALGAIGGWLGLVVSYEGSIHHGWRLASGATIVLVLTAGFLLVAAGRAVAVRVRRPQMVVAPA
ncbi:MAG TPA: metal ABC transporter permease [Acidimicrobiales bacterium]|jgi:manganese/iron transport system permease protein